MLQRSLIALAALLAVLAGNTVASAQCGCSNTVSASPVAGGEIIMDGHAGGVVGPIVGGSSEVA